MGLVHDSHVEVAVKNGTYRTDYLVVANIMTYKGDQEILEYCLRSILATFKDNPLEVYIMDDSLHPMDDRNIRWFKKLSPCIHYEQTSFERNRNLNGRAAVEGMLGKFIEHAAGRDALNLKIDPDTIICHREVFDEVYNAANADYAATTRPGCHFSGILYMFRTAPLEKALELARQFPIPEVRGPEDYIIGLAISAASLPKLSLMLSVWNDAEKKGLSAAWVYSIPKDKYGVMIPIYYHLFQFITMGNWFLFDGLTPAARLKPAEELVKLVEARAAGFEIPVPQPEASPAQENGTAPGPGTEPRK